MGKIVTYPREIHANGQTSFADIKDDQDREILARVLVENVRNWIDSDQEVMAASARSSGTRPAAPVLTQEELEAKAAAGEGGFGHTTIIEPADLDLYRSYMYPPLTMPAHPQVMVSYAERNTQPVNFAEGRVMVKAMCPDGIESWLVISVPVPNFYTALEGNCWGWPKYVCDEMTVTRLHSECIYEGKPSLTMDFSPGGVDEATIQQLKEQGDEGGNTVCFHMSTGSVGTPTLLRVGSGPSTFYEKEETTFFAEWEAGMITTWLRPEDKCSGLIPENCVTPGVWMRKIRTGRGGGGGMRKVQSAPVK
jgi:hypothetical protein